MQSFCSPHQIIFPHWKHTMDEFQWFFSYLLFFTSLLQWEWTCGSVSRVWTLTKPWASSRIHYTVKKTKTKQTPKPLGRSISAVNRRREQNPWRKVHLLKWSDSSSHSKKTPCCHAEGKLSSTFQHFSPPLRLFFPPTCLSFAAIWIPVVSVAQCEINRSLLD